MAFLIVCLFLLVSTISCETVKKPSDGSTWLPQVFPHLKNDFSKCSRIGSRSLPSANGFPVLVCDPDQLFSLDELQSLEHELREVLAIPVKFQCPCVETDVTKPGQSPVLRRNCPPDTRDDTFMVAVAAMRKMSSTHIREFGRDETTDSRLRAARSFAEQLKKKWFKGSTRCGEVFLIFYSADDNMLYVSTGQAAHQKVPNDRLTNLLLQVRPLFPGDPVAGIRHVINRLKAELKEGEVDEYAKL